MNQIHRLLVAACIAAVGSVGIAAPAGQDSTNPAVSNREATPRALERHAAPSGGLVKVPIIKVMAIGSFQRRPTNDQLKAILPGEMSETGWLYLDGKIDQWYARQDQSGVVFVLNATTVDEAKQWLSVLPLVKANLMTFEFIPLGPLQPLGTLLQPRLSQ
ncbi:hypothetical protein [Dyella sp. Tek66A03]|uniref:hypothetical protein n=1 Tax=Dyella sp. Tek66A03 TaxID=3458298 RepID=UPI00403E6AF4